ncbi:MULTISPECIES: acyl carrier protein [Streptomyces]|uniref:acyl carrier protein n=1 Tax=Streptomyces TaxID=1883 RepID=UPI001A8D04C2|nr:acyl carrier protein [Streptomyces sp. M54]QSS95523.1 acyl carrier protein [Streptomyces sp. M54]
MDQAFIDTLRPHLRYLQPDQSLQPADRLRDLGLNSMQAIDLVFDIEDNLGVQLPDDQLTDANFETAATLWAAVQAAGADELVNR